MLKKGDRHQEDLEPVPLSQRVIFPLPVALMSRRIRSIYVAPHQRKLQPSPSYPGRKKKGGEMGGGIPATFLSKSDISLLSVAHVDAFRHNMRDTRRGKSGNARRELLITSQQDKEVLDGGFS